MEVPLIPALSLPPFDYTPLQPREIRLLRLEQGEFPYLTVSYEVAHLDKNPDFIALSYCWGDPTPTFRILLAGSLFGVTESLHQFLRRAIELGYSNSRLWIDAICIDQNNIQERGHQVKLMKEVYSNAQLVVIWLGEEAENSDMAFELIKAVQPLLATDRPPRSEAILQESQVTEPGSMQWQALGKLFWRPWFSRLWIIQEVVLSRHAEMLAGSRSCQWDVATSFADGVNQHDLYRCIMSHEELAAIQTATRSYVGPGWQTLRTTSITRKDLAQGITRKAGITLYNYGNQKATDPRDKIFGILGLVNADQRLTMEPNYSIHVEEVYTEATKEISSTENTLTLIMDLAGIGWYRALNQLPSWTPDFSVAPQQRPLQLDNNRSASGSSKLQLLFGTDNTLQIKGLLIDAVSRIGPLYEDSTFPTLSFWHWYLQTTRDFWKRGENDESFWKALCGFSPCSQEGKDTIDNFEGYWEQYCSATPGWNERTRTSRREIPGFNVDKAKSFTLRILTISRRMCLTSSGRLGFTPERSQCGDIIAIAFGERYPFVIRPLAGMAGHPRRYHLVGVCKIEGLMDGEATEMGLSTTNIVLV
ncbi:hypothetical protein GLAREA_12171 [Glarea lozoyensis ATCC 20868]|uniref:Heterokaryon incompatibility domain-containing protein n=1 Tax=Glarea lozoyensis (strain ATCC 20868 / MF5171) TaxID=1116229 RepID=S3D4Q4_GLAL2|nr:uncharacterized protein GLAREA_12171 [Glarea lozoyensis ATCC 20868]EPE32089.1 hypothetical protein GLAREA_12171 [Glarea lozoyensis ATCC 20868]